MIILSASFRANAQEKTLSQSISEAMDRYEYPQAIALIDSALVQTDTSLTAERRQLILSKARCYKKLYKYRDASETLSAIINQEDTEVMCELADCYANEGEIEGALITYYMQMMRHPDNQFIRLQRLALLNKAGDWKGCIDEGKQLLSLDTIPQVLSVIGYSYANTGQADSALAYYRKALKMRPKNVGYLTSLSNLLLARKEYGEVIEKTGYYLVNTTPDEPMVESIHGLALYLTQNYDEAFKAFKKLKEDGDQSYGTFYYLGMSSLALKKYKDAAESLGIAWQIDSSDAKLAANYGTVLSRYANPAKAKLMFDKAEELMRPDSATMFKIIYGRGYLHYSAEQFKEAIPYYKQTYEYDNSYISALSTVGYCYERLKDFKNAKLWYEKYLEVGKPGSKAYKYVEESLEYVNGELFMEEPAEQ